MSGVIRRNPVLPITSAVKFEFSKDKLTMTGTDLETTYITSIDCQCKEVFTFPVSYEKMVEVCSNLFTPLVIEVNDRNISLTCDKWKSKISTAGGEGDYPKTSDEEGFIEFEVEGDFFYHLSLAASCKHMNDPRMNMPAIHANTDKVVLIGTDSNVLYLKSLESKANKENIVMVSANFATCCKLFQESKVSIGEKFIKVEHKNETIISRLSEQAFVYYTAVIRKDILWNMSVKREALKSALQSISVGLDMTTKIVNSVISGDCLKVVAIDTDYNDEAETEIEIQSEIEELKISFNSEKMMHFVSSLTCETLEFSFTDARGSIYIKPSDDDSVFCLVQPVAIESK